MTALTPEQKHCMRLAIRDAGPDGWATVSKTLWPLVSKMLPEKLAETEPNSDGSGGKIRITEDGRTVLEFS